MKLFAFAFLLLTNSAIAQYRGYNWVIPDSAGVDFNTEPPSVFYSNLSGNKFYGPGVILRNASCISNEQGELLFYTNGYNVYDRNHDTMPNGSELFSAFMDYNGTVALPYPDNEDSLYLILHTWILNAIHTQGIYYTVVNMNRRGGLGDVEAAQRNVPVYANDSMSSQLVAVRHANGRDWWVIGRKGGQKGYIVLLVTPQGVQVNGVQDAGQDVAMWVTGQMCANPQGTQLALAMYSPILLGTSVDAPLIETLDFDRCTGTLSHAQWLHPLTCYTLSYSPNGKLLYYNTYDTLFQVAGLDGSQSVTQLAVGYNPYYDPSSTASLNASFGFGAHQLGPDGKIYIAFTTFNFPNVSTYAPQNMSLCTIDSPDVQGAGCHFNLNSFYLGGKRSTVGMPNMPNYNLAALAGSGCDTITTTSRTPKRTFTVDTYPNPFTSELQIRIHGLTSAAELSVTNILGQRIHQAVLTSDNGTLNNTVDMSLLPSGVYAVTIRDDRSVYTRKVVKN